MRGCHRVADSHPRTWASIRFLQSVALSVPKTLPSLAHVDTFQHGCSRVLCLQSITTRVDPLGREQGAGIVAETNWLPPVDREGGRSEGGAEGRGGGAAAHARGGLQGHPGAAAEQHAAGRAAVPAAGVPTPHKPCPMRCFVATTGTKMPFIQTLTS